MSLIKVFKPHPQPSLVLWHMAVSCDFTRLPAVDFQTVPVSNCPDTCDSLHLTNHVLNVAPTYMTMLHSRPCSASHLLSNMPLYGHVAAINFNKLL